MKPLLHHKIIRPSSKALSLLLCFTGTSLARNLSVAPDLRARRCELRAQDQQGDLRSFEDLKGGNGICLCSAVPLTSDLL